MINQRTICAKIDNKVLGQLDMEAFAQGRARNRVLNIAIVAYTELQDSIRRAKCCEDTKDAERCILEFWTKWANKMH